jgi:hypothetical protein
MAHNADANANTNANAITVSIITVSQYSRRYCLANLAQLIQGQIYPTIIEWVIVEGSKTPELALLNAAAVLKLPVKNIVYVPFAPDQKLSDLRNRGNQHCKGDIIVCMDDDDYYPPTRVTHAVYRLSNSPKLLAGCSKAFIYYYGSGQFFQFNSFGKNHSTNNCLAYKREYLLGHAYAPGLDKAEETSFTKGFSEPMEQLDPLKTVVMSGHNRNTVDKSVVSPSMLTELTGTAVLEILPLPRLMKMEKILEELE